MAEKLILAFLAVRTLCMLVTVASVFLTQLVCACVTVTAVFVTATSVFVTMTSAHACDTKQCVCVHACVYNFCTKV